MEIWRSKNWFELSEKKPPLVSLREKVIEEKVGIFTPIWDCLWQSTICQFFKYKTKVAAQASAKVVKEFKQKNSMIGQQSLWKSQVDGQRSDSIWEKYLI